MDVVLGVAVTGRVARLAMVGSPASGGQVFDQYALDLPVDATTDLADTIVGTYRAVAESGNRVAATRLCLPDASMADTLRQQVLSAGVPNVEVVSEAEAAAALARSVGADAALLLADDDTVSLTVVGEDAESTSVLASVPIGAAGAAVACAAVLQQVPSADVTRIMLVGQRLDLDSVAAELRSTAPVEVAPDAGFAIARGAAQTVEGAEYPAGAATQMAPAAAVDATLMAPAAADATQMAPAAADATQMAPATGDSAAVGPQLAYSQADEPDFYEMPAESIDEFVPEQEDEEPYTAMIAPPPPKTLLMGSALAFVVVSFATLAVTVAINIRPVADVEAQPVPAIQSNTVPGRFLPPVPHEPDPVALPVAVVSPRPRLRAPSVRTNQGPVNNNAPAPQAPPQVPPPAAPAPAPQVPGVPIPPVIILPPLNPFPLPTFPTLTIDADDHHDDDYADDHDDADDDHPDDDYADDDHPDNDDHFEFGGHDHSDRTDRACRTRRTGLAAGDPGAPAHPGARVHAASGDPGAGDRSARGSGCAGSAGCPSGSGSASRSGCSGDSGSACRRGARDDGAGVALGTQRTGGVDGAALGATGVRGVRPLTSGCARGVRGRCRCADLVRPQADRIAGPAVRPRDGDADPGGIRRGAGLQTDPAHDGHLGAAAAVRSRGTRGGLCVVVAAAVGVRARVLLGSLTEHAGADHTGRGHRGGGRAGLPTSPVRHVLCAARARGVGGHLSHVGAWDAAALA